VKGLYDPVCFFFYLFGLKTTKKQKKERKLGNFSYFYVMLMPVCCQIVVTASTSSVEVLRQRGNLPQASNLCW